MASIVPTKSQPLHNFTLPQLKWNKDGHSSDHQNHHCRRSIKSPSRRPNNESTALSPFRHSPMLCDSVSAAPLQQQHQSPFVDSVSPRESPVHVDCVGKQFASPEESSKQDRVIEAVKRSPTTDDRASESKALVKRRGALIECRRNNNPKNSTSDSIRNDSDRAIHKVQTKSTAKEVDATGIKRSKILIKIPCKREGEILQDDNSHEEVQEEGEINNNTIDEEIKTWNLRSRKPLSVNVGILKNNGSSMAERNKAQPPWRNLNKCGSAAEKKKKRKLSIAVALTKEEIDEDIFALTRSKPVRRPKKRAKSIQKTLDASFPGLWLVSVTTDSYKVSENSLKG